MTAIDKNGSFIAFVITSSVISFKKIHADVKLFEKIRHFLQFTKQ